MKFAILVLAAMLAGCDGQTIVPIGLEQTGDTAAVCASKECELVRIVNGIDNSCYRFACDDSGKQWVEVKPAQWPCALRPDAEHVDWRPGRCDNVGVCQVSLPSKD